MKKNIVIGVIIILIITFASFFLFYKKNSFDFKKDLSLNKNLETFKNESLGFEFKYPTNSNIKDLMNKGQYGLRGGTGTIEDLNNSAKIDSNGDSSLISRVLVDGQEARTVCWQNGYCNISILSPKPMTLQRNPNKFYVVVIGLSGITPENTIQKKDLDIIISTFKFIDIKSSYEGL